MTDIFGAAAARAQQKRAAEKQNGQITLENNALVQLLQERREARAAEEAKAQAWMDRITAALDQTAALCGALGAETESVRYDSGILWIRRRGESIRLPVGYIRNQEDLRTACAKMLGAVCKV